MKRSRKSLDMPLLAAALTLLCGGLIMVYSASAILAEQNLGDPLYFFKRQLIWATLSLGAMAFFSRIDYNRLKEWMGPVFIATILGLVGALLSPPIAKVHRWIRFGPIGVQPAEFAKLTSVLFLAFYLDRKRSKTESLWHGLALPALVLALLLFLIGKQPDLGTPALMAAVALLMLFIGGTKIQYVLGALACAAALVVEELFRVEYRRARLRTFMNPFAHSQGTGYQLAQSIMAVGSGGWFGKGFGASKLKLSYLPTPHTDFIFPVICEELGLFGAIFFLSLFVLLLVRGMRIARGAPNLFGTLLASGITFSLCLQAFFNVGMSIGLLPTKGIPLPFISFGGSSLLATCIAVGVLLNISRQLPKELQ